MDAPDGGVAGDHDTAEDLAGGGGGVDGPRVTLRTSLEETKDDGNVAQPRARDESRFRVVVLTLEKFGNVALFLGGLLENDFEDLRVAALGSGD